MSNGTNPVKSWTLWGSPSSNFTLLSVSAILMCLMPCCVESRDAKRKTLVPGLPRLWQNQRWRQIMDVFYSTSSTLYKEECHSIKSILVHTWNLNGQVHPPRRSQKIGKRYPQPRKPTKTYKTLTPRLSMDNPDGLTKWTTLKWTT